MATHYLTLNLPPTATPNQIEAKYKKLKTQCEKDLRAIDPPVGAQARLDAILDAGGTLLNPDLRAVHDDLLWERAKTGIKDLHAEIYFDFASVRSNKSKKWQDLLGYSGSVDIGLYRRLLEMSTQLPYPDIQNDVLLAAMLTPSALANMLPIVFSWGSSGTGKSQISNMVSKLWGGSPQPGVTTYAVLRRLIASLSRVTHNSKEFELNNAICWDDVSIDLLKNPDIYSLLKSAVNRATSVIKVSKTNSDTETNDFQCFGGRYISSITPFFAEPQFCEMNRRMLIIECKRSTNAKDIINYDAINWSGLKEATNLYWSGENAERFVDYREGIIEYARVSQLLKPERAALCTDLLATGLTMGIWENAQIGFEALEQFYYMTDQLCIARQNSLTKVLTKCIENSDSRSIPATLVRDVIDDGLRLGLIDRKIAKGEITATMNLLGWELNLSDRVWVKS